MPDSIVKLATTYMALPVRLEVAPAGTTAAEIEQEIFIIQQESKLSLLEKLLQEYQGTVLVFSRTKFGAKKIASILRALGHHAAEIHANRSQSQRREAMHGFRSGKYRVLVATDIAARGIDVSNIEVVINFDLPDKSEDYVHRIGRTGRAGKKGIAISFATPSQRREIHIIERLIKKNLTISQTPELPPIKEQTFFHPSPSRPRSRPRRGYSSSRRSR
jgi:ATP-dependent RNA helicase RhlE